jgi:hypothetical protein
MSSVIRAAGVSVSSESVAVASKVAPTSVGLMRATWERWKKIAHAIGVVQTRVLMIGFFFLFAVPLGLLMRLSGDRLRLKPPSGTNWVPHAHQEQSLETARRQF